MKKWILLGLTILVWSNLAYGKSVTPRRAHPPKKPTPAETVVEKQEPCKAYIVVEATTGKVLEGREVHLKWPPASITKLMLSAVVLERVEKGGLQLSDKITVSRDASKMGGSQVFLKAGETFTLEELMKATMVASANDAAYAIGEHLAGSKEGFVALMNKKAKALKMDDTEFHSLHGLPPSQGDQPDLSSCSDLAVLARELVSKYPKILEWTSIQNDRFRDGTFVLNNHNKLLGKMAGLDGLKTGYYVEAGYNVVATAKKDDLRLIVVVMGSPTHEMRDRLALEKFKTYFASYEMVNIVRKGEVVDKEILLPDGKTPRIKAVAADGFSYPMPRDKKGSITKEVNLPEKLEGEVKAGQIVGHMVIKSGNDEIGKVNIVSPVHVPKAGLRVKFLRFFGLNS
jgi:serine-type D-Ala-D-Ala carboxypeptidase (penicillin-binding protein 5/6)